ncbi:MAG: hypothetical protein FRX49_05259 [Trebouxia sp. A1-2]|nr:MAG: hypothetical protein FRX49_05259 [Trebouxia sp. A1-2]
MNCSTSDSSQTSSFTMATRNRKMAPSNPHGPLTDEVRGALHRQPEDKGVLGGLCIQSWAKADQLLSLHTQGIQDFAPLFIVLTAVEKGERRPGLKHPRKAAYFQVTQAGAVS